MKISIRRGVFETNSSSVHSCAITTKDNYDGFKSGKLWYKENSDTYDWKADGKPGEYLPKKEAIEYNIQEFAKLFSEYEDLTPAEVTKVLDEYRKCGNLFEAFDSIDKTDFYEDLAGNDLDWSDYFVDYDTYWDINQYEDWEKEFTTPGGEHLIAWGYVGRD